jgi:hypothetical protein
VATTNVFLASCRSGAARITRRFVRRVSTVTTPSFSRGLTANTYALPRGSPPVAHEARPS